MTRIALLAALALTAGCDWEFPDYASGGGFGSGSSSAFLRGPADGFNQTSTLNAETRGTALDESGFTAGAAMNGTTCEVDTANGWVGADVDPDYSEQEQITDAAPSLDGQGVSAIAVTPVGLHIINYDDWDSGIVASYDIPALDARFDGDDGLVTINDEGGGCEVSWVNPRGDVTAQAIAAGNCLQGLDVATSGAVILNTSGGLSRVTGEGSEVIAESHDLVSYDASLDLFYVANRGESVISAMTDAGDIMWSVDLDADISDIEASPARGQVFASVEFADLTGGIVILDGASGDVVNSANTVSAARDLSLSGDGHTLAATVTGQVHFLTVE